MASSIDGLTIRSLPSDRQERERFLKGLAARCRAQEARRFGPDHREVMFVVGKDGNGRLVGGVMGVLSRDWLEVAFLWVDKKYRGLGLGSALMGKLEGRAVLRGARWSRVCTGDIHAPGFYPKLGFRRVLHMRFTSERSGMFFTKKLRRPIPRERVSANGDSSLGFSLESFTGPESRIDSTLKVLDRRMRAYTGRKSGPVHARRLGLVARDRQGRLMGGLFAVTFWDWLQLDRQWVSEKAGRIDLDAELLRKDESIAIQRGCRHALMEGFDFQKRSLWAPLGYHPLIAYKDFPKGTTKFLLKKELGTPKKGALC